MRRFAQAWALGALAAGCGSAAPPQAKDEAAVTYRAAFTSEDGVQAKVIFPVPDDASQSVVVAGLAVTDGGTARLESTPEGNGLTVEGKGRVEVTFQGGRVKGLGDGDKAPEAVLSRAVPDGGPGNRYLRVNKGGAAQLPVELEYTAARDCGAGCGGTRSWKYQGLVGLALQAVETTFSEETKP